MSAVCEFPMRVSDQFQFLRGAEVFVVDSSQTAMDISLNNGGGDDVYQSGSSFLGHPHFWSRTPQSQAGNNGRFSGVASSVIQLGNDTEH